MIFIYKMHYVELKLSTEQARKLKKGEQIQISKKHMVKKGSGIPMLVNSEHYNTITKTFDSNKGLRFKLAADEMEANSKPESIEDVEAQELISGSGLFAGGRGKNWNKKSREEKQAASKKARRKEKEGNPFVQISRTTDETTREISRKASEIGRTIGGINLEDVAKEIGSDLIKKVESMGDEVLGDFIDEYKKLSKEMKDTIKALDKASKLVSRNISPDKWANLMKEIPRHYRAELRDGPVGMLLREAIRQGAKAVMTSAIKAMYSNPLTAPLAPAAEIAYKLYGDKAIEELVSISGAGKNWRAHRPKSGRGLYAGNGLYAGSGHVQLQHEDSMPNFLLKKQLNLPTHGQNLSVGRSHSRGDILAARGGGLIHGISDFPATHGVPKPRPIKRLTMLTGHA